MSGNASSALALIGAFFPPDLSPAYLQATLTPLVQTLGMAAGGLLAACVLGLLAGILIGAEVPGGRALYAALTAVRAIPDLTLAILCVILVGIGPAAGLLALAIFYAGTVGKVYADLFQAVDRRPLEALRATGASRPMVAIFGLLPLALDNLLSFGCYAFECAVRAAVVVGAVGGGGLGTELVGTLNAFDYHRAGTLVLLLILLVCMSDGISWLLRRKPRLVVLLIPVGLWALWGYRPEFLAARHMLATIASMLPPRLPGDAILALPRLLLETGAMALAGTALAAVVALPLGALAARTLVPAALVWATRIICATLRAIPEVVWGLLLVVIVGVGPVAGMFALALHSAGVLGKLYAESFENVPVAPVRSIEATGAARPVVIAFAVLPLAAGQLTVHTLFRLEWNLRAATVIGMIGAGGIGQALYNAQQLFFYDQMMAYVILTWALVASVDKLSDRMRRRWGLAYAMA